MKVGIWDISPARNGTRALIWRTDKEQKRLIIIYSLGRVSQGARQWILGTILNKTPQRSLPNYVIQEHRTTLKNRGERRIHKISVTEMGQRCGRTSNFVSISPKPELPQGNRKSHVIKINGGIRIIYPIICTDMVNCDRQQPRC